MVFASAMVISVGSYVLPDRCMKKRPVLLKYNGSVHEIGRELHDSDDDSDMLSDTSYTEL